MRRKEMEARRHHGGEDRSGGIRCDFSVNVNPLGMPECAKKSLSENWKIYEEYPDDECGLLREALGHRFGLGPERIVCGNGASDLIYRLCLSAGFRRVLLPVPAFSEYERALRAAGCEIQTLQTKAETGYCFEESMLREIGESCDALFLCNPSNPAGGLITAPLTEKIAERCRQSGTILVADECFLDFVENGRRHSAVRYAAEGMPVIVLKAFTKIFAMAGLRLGFALFGEQDAARHVSQYGAPWQVSGPAQAAGLAVLSSEEERSAYLEATVRHISRERARMEKEMKNLGFLVVPGAANYILFQAPPELGALLLAKGFALRDCSDYRGLCAEQSVFYRAAVKGTEENRLLLQAMKECVGWQ